MVHMTMIARVTDGLPLAASMQEDQHVSLPRLPIAPTTNTVLRTIQPYITTYLPDGQRSGRVPAASQTPFQDPYVDESHQVFH